MRILTIYTGGYVCRWRGGSFIAAWKAERQHEVVPDIMISLPDSLNRAQANHDDIMRIARAEVG